MSEWISVKNRLPETADGITQLWLRDTEFPEFVLGFQAVMTGEGEEIHGVADMNRPDGIWDMSDFTHWMRLPPIPRRHGNRA
jgi:hypothetical protein